MVTQYYILNNYGTNPVFDPLSKISFGNFGAVGTAEAADPSRFVLYERIENGEGNTWGNSLDAADSAYSGANGKIVFTGANVSACGQLVVSNLQPQPDTVSAVFEEEAAIAFRLFPNPAAKSFVWLTASQPLQMQLQLLNMEGKKVAVGEMQNGIGKLEIAGLAAGNYVVLLRNDHLMKYLKLQIH